MPEAATATTAPPTGAVKYPPKKFVFVGEAGAGKTHLAASFPKPLVGFHFDNPDKADPYESIGEPTELKEDKNSGAQYRNYLNAKGLTVARVYFFVDLDPKDPKAWLDFQIAHAHFVKNLRDKDGKLRWNSAIYDSITAMGLKTRKDQQYRVNPDFKDSRLWRRDTTDEVEELIQITIPALPMNAIVITHISHFYDEVHGSQVHTPNLPGRLRTDIFSQYSEMYRLYVSGKDENGKSIRMLQTEANEDYHCYTQIGAPDGLVLPEYGGYKAIWSNYRPRRRLTTGS
jgi:hypothetical protein